MLDAEPAKLKKTGAVTVSAGRISVDGFEASGATCCEVGALSILWAIGELQQKLMAILERADISGVVVD